VIEIPSKVTAEPSVRPRKLVGGSCPTEFWQSLGPASKRQWADFGMTQVFGFPHGNQKKDTAFFYMFQTEDGSPPPRKWR